MKTFAEQVTDLTNTRGVKTARMSEIMQKAADEGRSTDQAEREEFDTLADEVKELSEDIQRIKQMEALGIQAATPVKADAGASQQKASAARGIPSNAGHIITKKAEKDEDFPGQNFTRLVIARTLAHLNQVSASGIAKTRWGSSVPMIAEILKANEIAGGGTGSGEWGSELVQADGRYTGDFIDYLKAQTVYDRLALREVPENVTINGQDGIGTGYWVGQSKAIPASAQDFTAVTLTSLDVAAISVVSKKLLRESSPAAEMLVRDGLITAIAQRIDSTFLSDAAAVASVSPAGLLRQVSAFSSDGNTAPGLLSDIKQLYAPFIEAKNASGLSFVANKSLAKSIQLMRNALDQRAFPGITQEGGTLEGDPIVTGDNVTANHLILLKPSDIYKIGDRGIQVSVSMDAMIEMNSAPTGASDTPTAASVTMVSMFQTESVALKVVRPLSFAKRRTHVAQYINDADYGNTSS